MVETEGQGIAQERQERERLRGELGIRVFRSWVLAHWRDWVAV